MNGQSGLMHAAFMVFILYLCVSCYAIGPFKNLVAFGDSYTDNRDGDGRITWPDYVALYSGNTVSVFDFARAGGTCSNKITPRIWPSVLESQIPEYTRNVTIKGGDPTNITYIILPNGTYTPLLTQDTLYSIWIGTNDVGADALLTDPLKDVSIVNTTACVFDWVGSLYNQGARNFLIQNMIPLYLTPMYSATGYTTKFWNQPHNQTEWSIFMAELVRSGNALTALWVEHIAPSRYPGATFGLFDSYRLFKDIYENPAPYLVGPPYNVNDAIDACKFPYGDDVLVCVKQPASVHDSYLWRDEVHPSTQVDRVIARHILSALNGQAPFLSWYGAAATVIEATNHEEQFLHS